MPASETDVDVDAGGARKSDFALPTADQTDWISTERLPGCSVLILSDRALTIQTRTTAGAIVTLPTGTDFWLNPAAGVAGFMRELVPPEFRLDNASGSAADVTVHLIPNSRAPANLGDAPEP